MPVTYRYDAVTNRLTTRCEGAVTQSEVIEHFRQLGRDSRLRPNCCVLLDVSFQTRLPTADQLNEIAAFMEDMQDLVPFGRCAVVAIEDLSYGVGRMFQGFAWPMFTGMRIFRSNAEALAWLDEAAESVE
ncbi:MAG TPA: STAS/SEC14 domain-containing protein [Pseudomonadales bacterium]|nr:STAS/SEC14 domain-containing protein [Pseudomonadales bacterium]